MKNIPSLFYGVFCGAFLVCGCGSQDSASNRAKDNIINHISNSFDSGQQQGGFKQLVKDYEDKSRVIWQKPELVIQLLGDVTSKTVADIGAGTGYFSFRVLPTAKKVIAIDIDQRFITFMDSISQESPPELKNKFEARLVAPNNPNLRPGEADEVMIVNTYMYIENRGDYLKILKAGMAKGGKIIIIDYKEQNLPVGPPAKIKVSMIQVIKELKSAGFSQIVTDDHTLDYQYIVTAVN